MESFAVLLLLCCVAGDEPVTKPVVKQEIVVTANRQEEPRDQASAAFTVLDRKEIERLPAASLSEVLAARSGLYAFGATEDRSCPKPRPSAMPDPRCAASRQTSPATPRGR